jgi:transcriptional regulator with XRE-family HTH domain
MSTNSPLPSVARSQLGARLVQLREESGLQQVEAAARAKVDSGGLSRIEGGTRGIKPPTAERLLDCYGVTEVSVRAEILELIRLDASLRRKPKWWKRHIDVLSPTAFDNYLALEAAATGLRNYEPLVLPGILQTAEYAHAVIPAMRRDLTAAQVKRLVEIRASRQRRILHPAVSGVDGLDSPRANLMILLDERALEPPAAGADIMRGQMQRLVEAAGHSQIMLRLSPKSVGLQPGLAGAFVIMKFPSTAARDVVCAELMCRSVYLDDEVEVSRYHDAFNWLWERALTTAETCDYLKNKMEELQW